MRAGIGLLGLLVAAAIIFWLAFGPMGNGQKGYIPTVMEKGKNARDQASQFSGHDENGVPASESIKVDPVEVGGRFKRLKVTTLVPGGPYETAYKLQVGDEVSEIGGLGVDMNDSFDMAEALLKESFQRNQPLTVVRNGQKLTLTPDTALSKFNPNLFNRPGTTAVPTH